MSTIVPSSVWARVTQRSRDTTNAWSPGIVWVVVALWTVVFGVLVAVTVLPRDWGIDGQHDLDVARSFAAGGPIYDGWYFYSPLATAVTIPATLLPSTAVLLGWALAKGLLLVACLAWLTPSLSRPHRILAALAVITFVGTLHDFTLGNTNVLITVALAVSVFGRDHWTRGAPLGVVLALVPKPFLIPVLFWLLVRRRPAFVGAVMTAAMLTTAGMLIAGPTRYADWFAALVAGTKYVAPFSGNLGLSATSPFLFGAVAAAAAVATIVATIRSDPQSGFVVALAAGVLASPYIGAYSAVPLLLAALIVIRTRPSVGLALAATAQIGTIAVLPLWTAGWLVAGLLGHQPRPATNAVVP